MDVVLILADWAIWRAEYVAPVLAIAGVGLLVLGWRRS